MTIQADSNFQTAFADNDQGNIDAAHLRDLSDSLFDVAGTMWATDKTFAVTPTWQPFNVFDNSIDTKGITEDFGTGRFTLAAGAGGTWKVDAQIYVVSPNSGTMTVGLSKNGALTSYIIPVPMQANVPMPFVLSATGPLAGGNTFGIAMKGSGSVTLEIIYAVLRGFR